MNLREISQPQPASECVERFLSRLCAFTAALYLVQLIAYIRVKVLRLELLIV